MKKTLLSLTLVLSMLALLAGCGNDVKFEARYERSNNVRANGEVTQITTKEQLVQYDDTVEGYTDEFFERKYLVIVFRSEGAMNITHEVSKVSEDGKIFINCIIPEMLYWAPQDWDIVVELDKDFAPESFNVVITEIEVKE
jgi:hypothetical protein